MPTIWIIHRDADQRAALGRIAGAGDNTVLGHPGDAIFASAAAADAIVLALSGDFEIELQLAQDVAVRPGDPHWIVLVEPGDLAEATRLFDTLHAEFLTFPPTAAALRRRLQASLRRRGAAPLSSRGGRDRVAQRFARWFGDMEASPELLRALDPKLARVPLLIRGEPGTGRAVLARYIDAFGGAPGSRLVHIVCAGVRRENELLDQLDEATGASGLSEAVTLWLEDVDRTGPRLQRRLQDWIDYGLPEGRASSHSLRWIATAEDEPAADLEREGLPYLEPRLAQSLAGLSIRIPPLRDRPDLVEPFVIETMARWCAAARQRMRSLAPEALEVLQQQPWPGNLRELESVIHRTLALTSADVLLPVHLRFEDETPLLDFFEPTPAPRSAAADRDSGGQSGELPDTPAEASPRRRVSETELVVDAVLGEEDDRFSGFELIEAEPIAETSESSGPDAGSAEGAESGGGAGEREGTDWPRLVNAIAHEVRNPLVSIRTFSELLPLHYEDEEFRTRFSELVGADVQRIEEVMDRLRALAGLTGERREAVEVSELLDELLDTYRDDIEELDMEVLTELDTSHSRVVVDPEPVRGAFDAIFQHALATASEGSDLYIACKHHEWGLAGEPTVRVVLRFRGPEEPLAGGPTFGNDSLRVAGTSPDDVDLAYVLAEAVFRAQGGSLAIDNTLPGETLLAVDLPAAP